MNSVSAVRLSLFFVAATAIAQGPAAVREYQPGIDATHYAINVVIPDSGRTVSITSVVYIRRTRAVDSLRLDLESAMRVTRVTVNANEAKFVRDAHTLRVALPKWDPSCANQKPSTVDRPDPCLAWVSVDATGEPTDGLIISKDPQGRWQYFTDHWPNRARQWLPVIDHPSDKATVEWRVIAPEALTVVANGTSVERVRIPNEPGRYVTAWRTDIPIAAYLFAMAAAPMTRVMLPLTPCGVREDQKCFQQDVYEAPELGPKTPPGFAFAGLIVQWMSTWVAPFPYEKLSHLESSTRFGGMENASAIFYSDRAFRSMTLADPLVAHETAHQWFGDAVTESRWADLWLSEGFATYFAALWERQIRGDSAFLRAMASIRKTVVDAPVVKTRPVIDLTQTDLMALLNANSYQKGGYVLHMMRRLVGDSAWIGGIRAYYAAHKHANASTDDLRTAMEASAKTDLKWFFDQWLTRPGYAELATRWTYDGEVSITIAQGTRWPPYRLQFPIEIEDATGVVTRTTITVGATRETSFTLPGRFAARPRRVTFDPDGDLLAVITSR